MTRIGSPIRDASVDPRPEDYQAPVNAGLANPHGRHVVAVQPGTLPYGRVPNVDPLLSVEGGVPASEADDVVVIDGGTAAAGVAPGLDGGAA